LTVPLPGASLALASRECTDATFAGEDARARAGATPHGNGRGAALHFAPMSEATAPATPNEPIAGKLDPLSRIPIHAFLLAIYPVLFLLSVNLGEVRVTDVVEPLVYVTVGVAVGLAVLTFVLHDVRRAAIIVAAVAITILAYGQATRIGARFGIRGTPLIVLWGLMPIVATIFALRARGLLAPVTRLLNVAAVVLLAITLVKIVPYESKAITTRVGNAGPSIVAQGAGTTRDIYYIILDRYGSNRSLSLLYNITDNDFYGWLRDHGFLVLENSHANYVKTSLSLAATLNLEFLDDVARQAGKDSSDQGPIDAMLQDHEVGRFLKSKGYTYLHIGTYFQPTKTSTLADRNIHLGGQTDFSAALLDDTLLPSAYMAIGGAAGTPARERQVANARFEWDALKAVRDEPGPKFVFAHLLMPHPPYVFAADGTVLSEADSAKLSNSEQYHQQLLFTNTNMKAFVERLLALPEERRPIIILQADEGPYPRPYARDTIHYDWSTATPDELETKYGILNGMYLPGIDTSGIPDTISSVNTFRLVFDRYFGANLPMLPDRSFTSKGKLQPYDLTDVTDRLPSLH
jgi:hypothetical protein